MAKLEDRESQTDSEKTNDTIPLLLQKTLAKMKPITREEGGPNHITTSLVLETRTGSHCHSQAFIRLEKYNNHRVIPGDIQ